MVLYMVKRRLHDRRRARQNVDEDEREHPDREHRERHPRAGTEQLQAPYRQSKVDRKPGKGS